MEVPKGFVWDIVKLPEQSLWCSVPYFHQCKGENGEIIYSLSNIGGPNMLHCIHENFKPRSIDVHVVTYPKAGTSWVQEIVWLVNNQVNVEKSCNVPSGERSIYIELIRNDGEETERVKCVESMQCPRHIKWHHASWLLPNFVTESGKIVYLYRNPKDTAVSWYHFQRMNKLYGFTGNFDQFLPLFMTDKVPYGSYWENLNSWWRLKDQKNILILSYEELHMDINRGIEKIANFLEKELTNEEVEKVIKHTSFSNMKANPMTNGSRIPKIEGETDFMRKGKVGDWKNYFTEEQNQKMDEWIQQKNKEHSIPFVFAL